MDKMVCHTDYITPNRTLETIRFDGSDTYLYVYNYKGVHFRLFMDLVELAQFFPLRTEPKYEFSDEEDLDLFLDEYLKDINSFQTI